MKKEAILSAGILLLGFLFEYLYLGTDQMIFSIKFWLLGVIFILVGALGLILYGLVPLLERRASVLGKTKKESFHKNSH